MNCAGYINRLLKTHGWDTKSYKIKKPEPNPDPSPDPSSTTSLFQDCMKSSKPIAPIPADCIEQLFNSFQAIAPLTGQKKGSFFRGHISLKNGTFCPLFSHDTTSFKRTCFLIRLKVLPDGLYRPHLHC
jgi:hypothetical protein